MGPCTRVMEHAKERGYESGARQTTHYMMVPNARPRERRKEVEDEVRRRTRKQASDVDVVYLERMGAHPGALRYLIKIGRRAVHLMETWKKR